MRAYFFVVGVLLVTSSVLQAKQSTQQNASHPLSVSDIEHGLRSGVTNTRMAGLVKQYGVDFEMNDSIEKELKLAGANSDVLQQIARNKRLSDASNKRQELGTQQSETVMVDDGTSLESTMKFIQETMNNQGTVRSVFGSKRIQRGVIFREYYETWDVVGAVSACTLHARKKTMTQIEVADGVTYTEAGKEVSGDRLYRENTIESTGSFRDVTSINVESLSKSKHVEMGATFTPEIYVLSLRATKKGAFSQAYVNTDGPNSNFEADEMYFIFRDEQTANRVAKAMQHAVLLCGGDSRAEPF